MSTPLDPEDILSESLETLYDYAPITLSSSGSSYTYTPSPNSVYAQTARGRLMKITLKTPETEPENWSLHASSIWISSVYLADHLDELHIDKEIAHARDREELPLRVLELGAGAGLPSILIAKRFQDDVFVVASDYPDDPLIETLSDNIVKNKVMSYCRPVPYKWGANPDDILNVIRHCPRFEEYERATADDGFDIVIAADTLWNPDLHPLLLQTLQWMLRKTVLARIYLIAGLHTGRYPLQLFMNALPAYGFEIDEIDERETLGSKRREWSVERGEGENERERRKWVLWICVKWKAE